MKQNKAIFLDKDGTLIPDIPYNVNPDLITLEEGAVDGLYCLQAIGYLLIIISNQSGVAKGLFAEKELNGVREKIMQLLENNHIELDDFYYCPHHPAGSVQGYNIECECRKPLPGMIVQAAQEHNIDLSASWMIGDILNDVEAGHNAGCRSILINNGNETEWLINQSRQPEFTATTITEAADYILNMLLHNAKTT